MPSVCGILMSVTITSKRALSSFFLAASPELTVSTLWPSRRRAMSNISQIERSSSQTRMLPMRSLSSCPSSSCPSSSYPSCSCLSCLPARSLSSGTATASRCGAGGFSDMRGRDCLNSFVQDFFDFFRRLETAQPHYELAALPLLGASPNLAFVALHDLINDGQAQPAATFEIGLEGFENLFNHLRRNARPGVGEAHLPIVVFGLQRDFESSAFGNGTHRVLAEIPEGLLELVAVSERPGLGRPVLALNGYSRVLRSQPMFEQGEGVVQQRHQIHGGKLVLLAARIRQEVGNDAVEALGLAGHNAQQLPMLFAQVWNAREQPHGAGDRGQRIADFMRDGRGQAAHGGKPVLHANFAFQTA